MKIGSKLKALLSPYWGSARVICKHLAEQPGPLQHYYKLMLERISGECPANWDGVFHTLSK